MSDEIIRLIGDGSECYFLAAESLTALKAAASKKSWDIEN